MDYNVAAERKRIVLELPLRGYIRSFVWNLSLIGSRRASFVVKFHLECIETLRSISPTVCLAIF